MRYGFIVPLRSTNPALFGSVPCWKDCVSYFTSYRSSRFCAQTNRDPPTRTGHPLDLQQRRPFVLHAEAAEKRVRLILGSGASLSRRAQRDQGKEQHRGRRQRYLTARQARAKKMKGHIQFITVPTVDTPGTALELIFQDKRYFFGQMHEGLQRAGLQHGAKLVKVKDFFLTGKTEWATRGGMLGMILSIADGVVGAAAAKAEAIKLKVAAAEQRQKEEEALIQRGKSKPKRSSAARELRVEPEDIDPTLRFRSGPNLKHILAAARSFIFRQGMPVDIQEFYEHLTDTDGDAGREPDFEDEKVQVWALPVKSSNYPTPNGPTRPVSPRKRTLRDYMDVQLNEGGDQQNEINTISRNESIQDFVVREMFLSQWRYDGLVEVPLHEVKLPATLFVRDPETKKVSKYSGPLPNGSEHVPNVSVLVRKPWPGALIDRLPPTKPADLAISYIVKGHRQRGKFKPQEAKRLGVAPGPLFQRLANGENVKAGDGTTVTPDMVLEPSIDGGGVLIADIPSPNYLSDFLGRPELQAESQMAGVYTIVWLLGPGVSEHPAFTDYVDQKKNLQQIVSSPDVCSNAAANTSAATQFFRHQVIDPTRYPSFQISYGSKDRPDSNNVQPPNRDPFMVARQGLKLNVIPDLKLNEDDLIPGVRKSDVLEQLPEEVVTSSQAVNADISSEKTQTDLAAQDLPGLDVEITTLGTGSMLPSLYRNVSATLLRVPGSGSYLLDCGENTLGQLRRVYPNAELQEIFEDLKLIWISHLHADHHLGTVSVIRAWYEAVHGKHRKAVDPTPPQSQTDMIKALLSGQRLSVVSNSHMARFLTEYSFVEDFGYQYLIPLEISESAPMTPSRYPLSWNGTEVGINCCENRELRFAMKEATGLSELAYCRVSHCWGANAVSLTFPSGFKFSYSGDCRPSKKFAKIGKDSTVLLHEATFDDELQGEAARKRHSTISEAIWVANAMRARRVILTHFSQRYAKMPNIDDLDKQALKLDTADNASEDETGAQPMDASADIPTDETSVNVLSTSPGASTANAASTPEQLGPAASEEGPVSAPPSRDMKIGIAFDYMRVKVRDIMLLEKFNPVMRELYKDTEQHASRPGSSLSVEDNPSSTLKNETKGQPVGKSKKQKCSDGEHEVAQEEGTSVSQGP